MAGFQPRASVSFIVTALQRIFFVSRCSRDMYSQSQGNSLTN